MVKRLELRKISFQTLRNSVDLVDKNMKSSIKIKFLLEKF